MEKDPAINQNAISGMSGEKEPSSFRLIFTLGLAGFVSGIILVAAYLYTMPLIEANKAAEIERAIYKVLPGCTSFKPLVLRDNILTEYKPVEKSAAKKGDIPRLIYTGYNEAGALIGFAIPGAEPGFQDIIAVMMGYDANKKTIIGYAVLECKETPGLGDKIFKDNRFLENFKALLTEPEILFVLKGEKKNANEVEGITGATISSKAVTRLLNNSMKDWKQPIDNYVKVSSNLLTGK